MSGKKAKAARRSAHADAPVSQERHGFWRTWKGVAVLGAAVAVIGASFVTPTFFEQESRTDVPAHGAMGNEPAKGVGLTEGSPVPAFMERDVISGRTISSKSLFRRKTLLFFSEGVMCQACFEQIRGLEQMGNVLERRGIELVSITPDSKADLEQAIAQYGITTSVISDDDRDMSEAFNTLGQGMHADMPGHAFVLVEKGRVLWQRDYWLSPYKTMYVEPQELLADIPSA
jgi:peroxiredoxin